MSKFRFMLWLSRIIDDPIAARDLLSRGGCANCLGRGFTGQHLDGSFLTCRCIQKAYDGLCQKEANVIMAN